MNAFFSNFVSQLDFGKAQRKGIPEIDGQFWKQELSYFYSVLHLHI